MKCPHCQKNISPKTIAKHFASKGGASGTGKAKARTSEQARASVTVRWEKYREK